MTMQITIDVPDKLGQQLEAYRERLPELLERGLQLAQAEPAGDVADVRDIIDLLASQPTPAQILAIRPSPEMQACVSDLLTRSKSGTLWTSWSGSVFRDCSDGLAEGVVCYNNSQNRRDARKQNGHRTGY